MRPTEICRSWVVYRMTLCEQKKTFGGNVVCEQREWEALELARPGFHQLISAGIGSEQEAEKLARGTAGDPVPRKSYDQKKVDRARREALNAMFLPQPTAAET